MLSVLLAAVCIIIISLVWMRTLAVQIKERKKAEKAKERLIVKLQNAIFEIKTLKGIVPICARCKKIRDDQGYWNLLESNIEDHSDASFSHGVCPECAEQMYGKEKWYLKMKNQTGK